MAGPGRIVAAAQAGARRAAARTARTGGGAGAAVAGAAAGLPVAASRVPYYSVHGIGGQVNYILPAKDFVLFFKYYDEYSAKARVQGRTIVFGGSWTFKFPKPDAKKP